MTKETKEFDKEYKKLINRGCIGLSIFVNPEATNVDDIARDASEMMKNMTKENTMSVDEWESKMKGC